MDKPTRNTWQRHLETDTRTSDDETDVASRRAAVPCLTILCHPDIRRIGEQAPLPDLADGREVEVSRLTPQFSAPAGHEPRPLADPHLSRRGFRIRPEPTGWTLEKSESRSPLEVQGKPLSGPRLLSNEALEEGVVLLLGRRITLLFHRLEPVISRPPGFGLVGESRGILRLRKEIQQVADLETSVLMVGESGTGKEMVARAIQAHGHLKNKPFVAVNMGAIPPTLAVAELFGAARGAFSGVGKGRDGYFQRAHGGTLFLDEIGEAPPEVQVLLLRALESGEVQPLGQERSVRVHTRVLAATDADLESAIEEGRFKAPLLHRLAGFKVTMSPLRGIRDDIGRLFIHFLRQELREVGEEDRLIFSDPTAKPYVPAGLMARLALDSWPGNMRQLRNVTGRLVVANRGNPELRGGDWLEEALGGISEGTADETTPEITPTISKSVVPPSTEIDSQPETTFRDADDVGENELLAALKKHKWALKPVATELGISRGALYARIGRTPSIKKASDLSLEDIEDALKIYGNRLDRLVDHLEVSKQGLKMRMKKLGLR